jgi:hypothetical protein
MSLESLRRGGTSSRGQGDGERTGAPGKGHLMDSAKGDERSGGFHTGTNPRAASAQMPALAASFTGGRAEARR